MWALHINEVFWQRAIWLVSSRRTYKPARLSITLVDISRVLWKELAQLFLDFREPYARNWLPRFPQCNRAKHFQRSERISEIAISWIIGDFDWKETEWKWEGRSWRWTTGWCRIMQPDDDERLKLRTGRIFMDNNNNPLLFLTILILCGSCIQTVQGGYFSPWNVTQVY